MEQQIPLSALVTRTHVLLPCVCHHSGPCRPLALHSPRASRITLGTKDMVNKQGNTVLLKEERGPVSAGMEQSGN